MFFFFLKSNQKVYIEYKMEQLQQRNTELQNELTDANHQIEKLKIEKDELVSRILTLYFI